MLVIIRNSTRKRLRFGLQLLIALFILSLIISHLYNMYNGSNMIREGWLRDDRPSGNPMRVDNIEGTGKEVKKDNPTILDEFVVKLRDFYQRDP